MIPDFPAWSRDYKYGSANFLNNPTKKTLKAKISCSRKIAQAISRTSPTFTMSNKKTCMEIFI